MSKPNRLLQTIDLFAGCGGLLEGFKASGLYRSVASVEWERAPSQNLMNRLIRRWGYTDAERRVMRFDIQRTQELFSGWSNDPDYGESEGLDRLVQEAGVVDLIIGGPPCQAYSLAGRVRDKDGMRYDYRNFLFESYLKVVKKYQPRLFVFENVVGMLTANPGGVPITDQITESFNEAGYEIIHSIRDHAVIDLTDYGVPQSRKRVILVGLRREDFPHQPQEILKTYYQEILPSYKITTKRTVEDMIGNLPEIYPLAPEERTGRVSHRSTGDMHNHIPRFHNNRDIEIFKELAQDVQDGNNRFVSAEALKKLYTEKTGKVSNVHKYYVLRWKEQSNTIPAHLYKDGLRHIHPDPDQARSITVREAARLQTFDDNYEFIGSMGEQYKMIGNAVPPAFAKILALSVHLLLTNQYEKYFNRTDEQMALSI